MSNPLGTADFFALEAGECLDRLEQLVTRPQGPPPDEMLRYARALRGSALMASHSAIARAAAALEAIARGLRDGTSAWEPAMRERAGQAIDEFRLLVRNAREWSSADAVRASRIEADLLALAGEEAVGTSRAMPAPAAEPAELNTGVRAFVAREGALIASALDRAARALRETPGAREPLYAVLRRMQSLRGLAELSELTPLPEILDGIELAVGDLTRLFAPPPDVHRLLESAAQALTRIARDVAGSGRPAPDPDEARLFTEQLLRAFAVERDVVPIESLYVDGDATPFHRSESQPQFSAPTPLSGVELVSYGEHLFQAADRIVDAESATIRDLRLYSLVGTLRSVATAGGDPVAAALTVFGRSAREAIASGAAAGGDAEFAAILREAGALLRSLADAADQHEVGRRLLDLAHRLDQSVAQSEEKAADARPAPAPANLADADIVPIESLDYATPDEARPATIPSRTPDAAEVNSLEATYATYGKLIRDHGLAASSVDQLIRRPHDAGPDGDTERAPVDIRDLCYRGRAALERAVEVRDALAARLSSHSPLLPGEPLLLELLDLVPLALDRSD